jgi:hypothetical protein
MARAEDRLGTGDQKAVGVSLQKAAGRLAGRAGSAGGKLGLHRQYLTFLEQLAGGKPKPMFLEALERPDSVARVQGGARRFEHGLVGPLVHGWGSSPRRLEISRLKRLNLR